MPVAETPAQIIHQPQINGLLGSHLHMSLWGFSGRLYLDFIKSVFLCHPWAGRQVPHWVAQLNIDLPTKTQRNTPHSSEPIVSNSQSPPHTLTVSPLSHWAVGVSSGKWKPSFELIGDKYLSFLICEMGTKTWVETLSLYSSKSFKMSIYVVALVFVLRKKRTADQSRLCLIGSLFYNQPLPAHTLILLVIPSLNLGPASRACYILNPLWCDRTPMCHFPRAPLFCAQSDDTALLFCLELLRPTVLWDTNGQCLGLSWGQVISCLSALEGQSPGLSHLAGKQRGMMYRRGGYKGQSMSV